MWVFLDLVARLIALGGLALVVWFVWRIISAPNSQQRLCVCCGASLYALELATCADCLAVSSVATNSAGELLHCGQLLDWYDCPDCLDGWCFGAHCAECDYILPYDCKESAVSNA